MSDLAILIQLMFIGWSSTKLLRDIKIIKYWKRLIYMKDDRLTKNYNIIISFSLILKIHTSICQW